MRPCLFEWEVAPRSISLVIYGLLIELLERSFGCSTRNMERVLKRDRRYNTTAVVAN